MHISLLGWLTGSPMVFHLVVTLYLWVTAVKTGGVCRHCHASLTVFQLMCDILHVPLRPDNTVTPCRSLCFLGVDMNVVAKWFISRQRIFAKHVGNCYTSYPTARPPSVYYEPASAASISLAWQSLQAVLFYDASDLCIGVRRQHHHRGTISRAARLDMRAWLAFLSTFNGRSMLIGRRWHTVPELLLEADAAGAVGFGAVYGSP